MQSIEEYTHSGPGYNPFLIRPGWQVAQLNYAPKLAFDAIGQLERHKATDEAFILFSGRSVLITGSDGEKLQHCLMQTGVVYNIPAGSWHAIAMQPDDVVFIVEKSNTHLSDVEYRKLSERESEDLKSIARE